MARKPPRLPLPPGWQPGARTEKFAGERTEKLLSDLRVEDATAAAVDCADCAALQKNSNDPTALCRPHLSRALGL